MNKITVEGKRLLLLNHVNEKISSPRTNNLKLIRDEVSKLVGKFVKIDMDGDRDDICLLTCAVCDNDDYYYLMINLDRKIRWVSCTIRIREVDWDSLGVEYNILKYLIDHDSEYLLDMVQKLIDKNGVIPFTDLKVK